MAADYSAMVAAAAFTEVLDRCVEGFQAATPAAGAWQPGVATRSLFWFEGAADVSCRSSHSPAARARDTGTRAHHRRHRSLSASQRDALERLIALGAPLDAGFTAEELRSAFRALARAYHPDRHPGCNEQEQARLAAAFAALRDVYDCLRTAA